MDESPVFAYLTGMLFPRTMDELTLEALTDVNSSEDAFSEDDDYTPPPDEDDNDPVSSAKFKKQSSIGMSFYVKSSEENIKFRVRWGDYHKFTEAQMKADGSEKAVVRYQREGQEAFVDVNLNSFARSADYLVPIDSNVKLHITKMKLKTSYTLVTAYVINERPQSEDIASVMFQVELAAVANGEEGMFMAEHICREILEVDEFYYEQRPVFGRGRGCAVVWESDNNQAAKVVSTAFIPEYEFPGVSAALEGFDKFYFSMRLLGQANKREVIFERLNVLATSYEKWINEKLIQNEKMQNPSFAEKIGNKIISKCVDSLNRIKEGIALIETNDRAYTAFCFMNRVMILQRAIGNYSKKHSQGKECAFVDFLDPHKEDNEFGWRPFQIAFILMNISGIVNPLHRDRNNVDLLYFPTGGGKTEAYLGLIAFVIANRRLQVGNSDGYNRDGGVTAILRYTLRLLTTQQRDRLTKMILAAEMVREKEAPKFGNEPISIGFWVGGGVTPNEFVEFRDSEENPEAASSKKRLLRKQILVPHHV